MANQVITNFQRAKVTGLLAALTGFYLGVGTGTAAATNADTALQTEVTTAALGGSGTYSRAAATLSQQTTTVTNDTFQGTGTWTNPSGSANTIAVTEFGLFDAATAGNLYFHAVIAALNIPPGSTFTPTTQSVFN